MKTCLLTILEVFTALSTFEMGEKVNKLDETEELSKTEIVEINIYNWKYLILIKWPGLIELVIQQ